MPPWTHTDATAIISAMGIPKFTDRTITDPEAYLLEVQRSKENGVAVDDEEYIAGVRAAAAPIEGKRGTLYAIWGVGFKSALDDQKMAALISGDQGSGGGNHSPGQRTAAFHPSHRLNSWCSMPK